jgi:hypothetical protein
MCLHDIMARGNKYEKSVSFNIGVRKITSEQIEAENRLFRQLVEKAQKAKGMNHEQGGSARVEGGSRHPAGSPPHLLTGGLLRTQRDQNE